MARFKPIENNLNYLRDTTNNGLINIDNDGLNAYKRKKISNHSMQNDINSLKQDMNYIKNLLEKLLINNVNNSKE